MRAPAAIARSAALDRRAFLKMAGAAWAAALAPDRMFALERADTVYASGFMAPDGSYGIATVTERGEIIDRTALPARSHGMAVSPASGHAVAFARRPGTFAMVFDPSQRMAPTLIHAVEGRHFYGHGCFSPDGRILYASENDFDAGRGVVGLYDATHAYARIGEFQTYGIGTHDMTVTPDGRFLVVANGGIETHPDFGRTKLNLDRMEPSLALVDAANGTLVERHAMPAHLSRLSTRHVDLDGDGRIWFACQYEGARNELPPLTGHFRLGEPLSFVDLPEETTVALANYVGAIAVNRQEGLVGLTSPKGGSVVTLSAATGKVLEQAFLPNAAGIAAAPAGFAVSSYDGHFGRTRHAVAWDQHILRL